MKATIYLKGGNVFTVDVKEINWKDGSKGYSSIGWEHIMPNFVTFTKIGTIDPGEIQAILVTYSWSERLMTTIKGLFGWA